MGKISHLSSGTEFTHNGPKGEGPSAGHSGSPARRCPEHPEAPGLEDPACASGRKARPPRANEPAAPCDPAGALPHQDRGGTLGAGPRWRGAGAGLLEAGTRRGLKDDDIEEGDLPEHKRPSAPIDFSQIDPGRPESILKMTKKGKTLMMFVTVSGSPTEKETEEITSLWQGSLFNANYDVQRFIVGSDRAIFMLRDGSYAWEIKDFLVSQDRCADVTLEGQVYPGKGGGSQEKNKTKQEKGKKKKEGVPKSRAAKVVQEDNRAGNKREEL
eukprot:XP_022271944.1 LDLR chaperone MESD [Canis lupus familiaris]